MLQDTLNYSRKIFSSFSWSDRTVTPHSIVNSWRQPVSKTVGNVSVMKAKRNKTTCLKPRLTVRRMNLDFVYSQFPSEWNEPWLCLESCLSWRRMDLWPCLEPCLSWRRMDLWPCLEPCLSWRRMNLDFVYSQFPSEWNEPWLCLESCLSWRRMDLWPCLEPCLSWRRMNLWLCLEPCLSWRRMNLWLCLEPCLSWRRMDL